MQMFDQLGPYFQELSVMAVALLVARGLLATAYSRPLAYLNQMLKLLAAALAIAIVVRGAWDLKAVINELQNRHGLEDLLWKGSIMMAGTAFLLALAVLAYLPPVPSEAERWANRDHSYLDQILIPRIAFCILIFGAFAVGMTVFSFLQLAGWNRAEAALTAMHDTCQYIAGPRSAPITQAVACDDQRTADLLLEKGWRFNKRLVVADFTFVDGQGKRVKASITHPSEAWNDYGVGQQFDLRYEVGRPDHAELPALLENSFRACVAFSGVFLAALLVFLWMVAWRVRMDAFNEVAASA